MNEQKTQGWHDDRCGKITASRLKDCLAVKPDKWRVLRATGTTLRAFDNENDAITAWGEANAKKAGHTMDYVPGEPLQAWRDYCQELVAERLTGEVRMIGEPPAIRWGNDNEAYAVRAYENKTGEIVQKVGFVEAPSITGLVNFGASPDGQVLEKRGGIEIKCPFYSANHVECFRSGIPDQHKPQMEGQLLVNPEWDYVDFVSYDPRFSGDYAHLQLFVARYHSDPDLAHQIQQAIITMEAGVVAFLGGLPGPGDV